MNAQRVGPTGPPAPHGPRIRHYELDWLRTLVVLGIIPYHVLVIFGASSAVFLKSAQSTPALALLGGFALTWGIPTIFLMAGAATRLALEHRTPGAVVRERLVRLLVPLTLVALVFSPLQAYFILRRNPSLISMSPVPIQHPEQLRSFGAFYRTYLTLLVTTVRAYSPRIGTLVLAHVWFIPRLLVVTLFTLLLIVCLRRSVRCSPAWITPLGRRPALSLFGAGVLTALVVALLRPGWLEHVTEHWLFTDVWSEFFLDLALFLCGYLIYASHPLRATVNHWCIPALLLGLLCWTTVASVTLAGKAPPASFLPAALIYAAAWALSAWLVSLALLGLAMRYLAFSSPGQRYLTYAAFPVYLLHMPVLTISAYFLLRLPLPWYVQLVLITTVTLLVAFGIFELALRRTAVTRFLFGIKIPRSEDSTHLGVRHFLPQPSDAQRAERSGGGSPVP